jgi:hypothetical protein
MYDLPSEQEAVSHRTNNWQTVFLYLPSYVLESMCEVRKGIIANIHCIYSSNFVTFLKTHFILFLF